MNKRIPRILIGIVLSFAMVAAGMPSTQWVVYAETSVDNNAEGSAQAEASASVFTEENTEESDVSEEIDDAEADAENEEPADTETAAEEVQSETGIEEEEDVPVQAKANIAVSLSPDIENGSIEYQIDEAGIITGTATPSSGYDLATIRALYSVDGEQKETYIDFNEDDYSFSYNTDECAGDALVLTATFNSTEVWDGGVDVTWYDPENKSFDIYTPAEFAGVAAIVNGMVDPKETREDQIKDHKRTVNDDGTYEHEYIQTRVEQTRLLEQQGGGVEDEVYRLPEARKVGIFASDDLYNDMRYREIHLRADIDMGTEHNYNCIGGKHAMNTDAYAANDNPVVIDTRFQGVLDGHGHTVTITCNKYCKKGYGYSWNVGLVGYLGGLVDRETNNAKDNKIFYAAENHPTVRNVVVKGTVLGRRCTGGVVGRIGETNYSCIVENCANYATVRATDMRGTGGIVGGAWGVSVIRNCYNAGEIRCRFDEVGGIVGSNGYQQTGADIINCFNVGEIRDAEYIDPSLDPSKDTGLRYLGKDIGIDGEASAPYTLQNCYWLDSDSAQRDAGFATCDNGKIVFKDFSGVNSSVMKSSDTLDKLNECGDVFVSGGSLNDGYPVLYFEKNESGRPETCTVSAGSSANGQVLINGKSSVTVPYGTVVELSSRADEGYRINSYQAGGKEFTQKFYTVTGDASVTGRFTEVERATLTIPSYANYTLEVVRTHNGSTNQDCSEAMSDGDVVFKGDILEVTGHLKADVAPADINYEYSGRFDGLGASDEDTVEELSNSKLKVTGTGDVVLQLNAVTRQKDWVTLADTSWYKGHEGDSTYTINNARQLAGMAKLISDGVDMGGTDFKGKTIILGSDIDMTNDDGTDGRRLWRTVGNNYDPFRGTFDGKGHEISNIYVSFALKTIGQEIRGTHGGLFGVAQGATIRNVTISGNYWATSGDSGAVAGNAIDTTIENCTSNVHMENVKETAGIVGKAEGTTVIRNCINSGSIQGTTTIAGIVGTIGKASTNSVKIENCVNNGDISSTYHYVGGIAARCQAAATVSKCINNGNVEAVPTAAVSTSDTAVGGIVGADDSVITIDNCANTGAVTASGKIKYAGGILGYVSATSSTISNCYNTGAVKTEITSSRDVTSIGGILNVATDKKYVKITVQNCYNTGAMSTGSRASNAGGIAGAAATGISTQQFNDTKFANNYYSQEAVADLVSETTVTGTKKTADAIRTSASALGKAYVPDVNDRNSGFPILAWQDPSVDVSVGTVKISSVKASGTTAAVISWNALEDSKTYEIYRAKSISGTYTKIATVTAVPEKTTYTYKNTGLTPGGWYYYKVRASRDVYAGNIYYGAYSGTKNVRLALAKPVLKSVANVKGCKAKITWTKLSGATGYEIYRSTKKSSGYKKIKTITKGSTVTFTDSKLSKKKTYYYKIRACSKVNSKTIYSTYSVVKYAKIKK